MQKLLSKSLMLVSIVAAFVFFLACRLPGDTVKNHSSDIAWYRIQVTVTCNSDWTSVVIDDSEQQIGWRTVDIQADPSTSSADWGSLFLQQSVAEAEAGGEIGAVIEYAVSPVTAGETLSLTVSRGYFGATDITVTAELDDDVFELGHIVHDSTTDGAYNEARFEIELQPLSDSVPRNTHREGFERLVWAFYYVWYDLDSWESDWLFDVPVEPYISNDTSALRRHVVQARESGIDGLICSWWGPDYAFGDSQNTDENFASLIQIAAEEGIYVTAYLEILDDDDAGRDAEELVAWLVYLLDSYGENDAYYRIDGRPVVFVWASEAVTVETWKSVFADVRVAGFDGYYIAMGLEGLHQLEVFDGIHEYGLLWYEDADAAMARASRIVRNYGLLAPDGAQRLWAAVVNPGYDDSGLPFRPSPIVVDRQAGTWYRESWAAAISTDPDWVVITSWNEWWEHTYIEPSETWGERFLEITADEVAAWKR